MPRNQSLTALSRLPEVRPRFSERQAGRAEEELLSCSSWIEAVVARLSSAVVCEI